VSVEGGLSIGQWMALWGKCHAWVMGCPMRLQWPDGGSLMDQPALTVEMFELIESEWLEELEAQRERDARK